MKCFMRDESGAVVVIVAIVMAVLLGLAAVAVDQGYLFDTRHQLQAAADAAALAGCSTLIETSNAGQADAAARDYAARNASGAGSGLTVDAVNVDMAVEPWSVRVAVSRPVPAWFAGIFGVNSTTVRAVAKAEKQPLTGARRLMPWGLPIILEDDVVEVRAVLVDAGGSPVSSTVLGHTGTRHWSGAVAAPAARAGYDLRVALVTQYAGGSTITEWVGDSKGPQSAARVVVPPTDYPFSAVSVENDYGASDESFAITVRATTVAPATKVTISTAKKSNVAMTGSGTSWSATLTSADLPFDDGFLDTYPLDIYTGAKADGFVDAYAHVRRSSYPVSFVTAAPGVATPGSGVAVDVELNDFNPSVLVPGQIYTLRVGPDGVETGNFGEVNYNKIVHQPGCTADPVGVDLGSNVRDWVAEGYGGAVHIGDIIPLSPGNSGWTDRVVADRIAKYGNVILMPIVAKYQEKSGGSYDVIVRAFGAFRVTQIDSTTVRGEFIEYVATPSSYGTPGGGGTVFQARLVNP